LTNDEEVAAGTDPNNPDSDGDGYNDGEEVTGVDDPSTPATPTGTSDPADACDPDIAAGACDSDGDGMTNAEEITGIDDPSTPGIPSGSSNPTDACDPDPFADPAGDCDGDGMTNGDEEAAGSDPLDPCDPDASGPNCTVTPIIDVDLTPNYTTGNNVYNVGDTRYIVANINEIVGGPTTGLTRVFVPFMTAYTIVFDNTLTSVNVVNGETVNNPDWTVTSTPGGLLFETNTIIDGNTRSRIALEITANAPGAVANLTTNIVANTGGENFPFNNVAILTLSTQR